jgi:hypothetical protein
VKISSSSVAWISSALAMVSASAFLTLGVAPAVYWWKLTSTCE